MRALALAAGIALLCACGEKEPDIACCAIEPKAKCESALAGLGVSREQLAILMTAEKFEGVRFDEEVGRFARPWNSPRNACVNSMRNGQSTAAKPER